MGETVLMHSKAFIKWAALGSRFGSRAMNTVRRKNKDNDTLGLTLKPSK